MFIIRTRSLQEIDRNGEGMSLKNVKRGVKRERNEEQG
jgi:hypothetical protein